MVAGLGLAVLGGVVWLAGRIGLPLGRLPGDLRIVGGGSTFYFPLASCLVVSLLLTLGLNLLLRLFRK